MYSFGFPRMLNSNTSNLLQDKEAVRSNMILLLSSERNTLFGDPYFGAELRKYIFEQAGSIVPDLLIDALYTTIRTFMPQVYLTRKDISVYVSKKTLYADINYYYIILSSSKNVKKYFYFLVYFKFIHSWIVHKRKFGTTDTYLLQIYNLFL